MSRSFMTSIVHRIHSNAVRKSFALCHGASRIKFQSKIFPSQGNQPSRGGSVNTWDQFCPMVVAISDNKMTRRFVHSRSICSESRTADNFDTLKQLSGEGCQCATDILNGIPRTSVVDKCICNKTSSKHKDTIKQIPNDIKKIVGKTCGGESVFHFMVETIFSSVIATFAFLCIVLGVFIAAAILVVIGDVVRRILKFLGLGCC